ncbi:hypothetical protein [Noviherbaspirillum sp.]|uniref:hypothetical protein n=1 Tax=Noviherbaspirillum sp. TaxID=1926288 RepID=UPI002D2FF71B|nr:hypothetical protein [Noviherbaspirillum sp.]HZW22304.1 hypothetical protein [Noviherbaspirillum sp.]
MKVIVAYLMVSFLLVGCGVETAIKRNDDRYLRPGALDLPLNDAYDTFRYKFLDEYLITHQWPRGAGACRYAMLPTMGVNGGSQGEVWNVSDIYEKNGKTWQSSSKPEKPFDFDRYVRSVKAKNPVYGEVNGVRQKIGEEEIEVGLQTMCHQSWYSSQHSLSMLLRKWTPDEFVHWLRNGSSSSRVFRQKIGDNEWTVVEFELEPQSKDGASSGPFQFWILPIEKTGYSFLFRLGANRRSLEFPDAHVRFQTAFRHLIESVRIEPLT